MGQRINIQYSVDIDELDVEVQRMMKETYTRYSSLQSIYNSGDTTILSNEMLEKVDQFRVELAKIDHQLSDVSNIISGYLYYKMQQNTAAAQDAQMPAADDLESRIKEFKDTPGGNEVSYQGK
tara:strand:+ start:544 stop:912 length:369 start_codon:yes stop_codon:yes gene_type:complete